VWGLEVAVLPRASSGARSYPHFLILHVTLSSFAFTSHTHTQGGNALIIARQKAKAKQKKHKDDDGDEHINVASDQLKYHNLLRGVQLGINLQSKNYNDAVTLEFKKTKRVAVVRTS
jgi:hypothetical protein